MPPTTAPFLEVLQPGLLSTIQDAGRFDHRDEGVPVAGACDAVALAVANLILANPAGAAAIECTILGPELLALDDGVVGVGGADLGASVQPGGRPLRPGMAHRLVGGERIVFGARPLGEGCRAYLAVPGGIDVPAVLGSRSTSLVGAFGGLDGRPLRAGDRLAGRDTPGRRPLAPRARWPGAMTPRPLAAPVRVLPSPGPGGSAPAGSAPASVAGVEAAAGPAPGLESLLAGPWRVAAASDRRGLRLEGASIAVRGDAAAASHGVLPGTVQVTPSGQPLVLLNDAGTTGGYPVIGVVIAADLWRLGQARPGATLLFEATDRSSARDAASDLQDWLDDGVRQLEARAGDAWDDLADDAGR